MNWAEWGAICAAIMLLITVGGLVFRLSGRLTQTEARADAAAKEATAAAIQAAHTDRELVEHRVYVAREYVSNQTIAGLEQKLIEAIDRLGTRLDSLFMARSHGAS